MRKGSAMKMYGVMSLHKWEDFEVKGFMIPSGIPMDVKDLGVGFMSVHETFESAAKEYGPEYVLTLRATNLVGKEGEAHDRGKEGDQAEG